MKAERADTVENFSNVFASTVALKLKAKITFCFLLIAASFLLLTYTFVVAIKGIQSNSFNVCIQKEIKTETLLPIFTKMV